METQNYAVLAKGKHEYDIAVIKTNSATSFEMRYSHADHWNPAVRGERILSATDHGNGVKFTEKFKRAMDYDKFVELRILMNFICEYDENFSLEYKFYQSINSNQK